MKLFKVTFLGHENQYIETFLYEENESKAKLKALERLEMNNEYKRLLSVIPVKK